MAKKLEEKLAVKRRTLLERTCLALDVDETEAIRLLSLGRKQSVRLNSLQAGAHVYEELAELGWHGEQYNWFSDGYTIERGLESVRDSTLAANGKVYIQNAASWLPVLALDPQAGENVLDVCAAPGGKTSHIAAHADNKAHIIANDNSRPRLAKLRANLQRLGVEGVEYTLFDATLIARKLDGQLFDKILLDAPCSGEGMMRYDSDKDFTTWSVAHIKRLQQLQKRILTQAWQLLKPGGTLVYSTCTMAPEENEAVVDYILRHTEDACLHDIAIDLPNAMPAVLTWNNRTYDPSLSKTLRLVPSTHIEAFFVAKLVKNL